uniref:Septin-1 n=2 Tax=Callorhinus ursinus TaxID=34884 RepID=A0A3Q7MRD0_CALUR|nr:septin-1 [Callorhinus ursinus]
MCGPRRPAAALCRPARAPGSGRVRAMSPRRPRELLGGAPLPEPPAAPGCGLRAKWGGGSDPGVPGAAAGGGDGKRKRWASPSRSRTQEELHACGGCPRPPELGGRREAACRGQGYSKPKTVARTRCQRDPGSENSRYSWSWVSPPVRASQLPTLPAPLFATLNFLPHQRKWGEIAGAATASRAMDKEYVGFAALPNQLHRKSVKKGFDFTLMVAGESGLGKSTLINSLFLTNLYEDRQLPEASARLTQTLTIERRGVEIEEGGIKVKLTLVDTPGFGDSVDCSDCWLPVVRFIEEQFEQYLRDESGLNRKNIQDSRVHCCLYFISPFGRGLRPLDVAFLRAVHEKVNIIPVIGKADALMPKETQALKQRIRDQLKEEEINIYQFPDCDSDEDEDFKRQDAEMKESIPFAVVGSCEVVRDGGTRPVRGRRYSWGTVEVENPHHCDFLNLRRMLVQTHLQDLKEVTHDLLYEGYRARCLQSLARPGARDRASRSKLSRQSATEIPLPMLPLAETEKLIREKDEELRRMQEMLEKMQAQMQQSQTQGEQSEAL